MPHSRLQQVPLVVVESNPFDCCGQRIPTCCLVVALLVLCLPAATASITMIVIGVLSQCNIHPKLPLYFMISGGITLFMLLCIIVVWFVELRATRLNKDWRLRHCAPYVTITSLLLCFGWHIFVTVLTDGLRVRHKCDYLNEPYAVWCVISVTVLTGMLALLHCCTFDWKVCEAEVNNNS